MVHPARARGRAACLFPREPGRPLRGEASRPLLREPGRPLRREASKPLFRSPGGLCAKRPRGFPGRGRFREPASSSEPERPAPESRPVRGPPSEQAGSREPARAQRPARYPIFLSDRARAHARARARVHMEPSHFCARDGFLAQGQETRPIALGSVSGLRPGKPALGSPGGFETSAQRPPGLPRKASRPPRRGLPGSLGRREAGSEAGLFRVP